jgi:16S rRNA (guanine527-N7)-methyltransferase
MSERRAIDAAGTAPGAGARLNVLLAGVGLEPVDAATAARFEAYLALLQRWNAKINLTAIRDQEGILARHFVESIACARALPAGIASLLDYGSGAGFPGIPIALCRPGIAVTLAERQAKKAAFLREAARVLGLGVGPDAGIGTTVFDGRAETLTSLFDCVVLRAVDRMAEAVQAAGALVGSGGWLALMTTAGALAEVQTAAGSGFEWEEPVRLAGLESGLLALGRKA